MSLIITILRKSEYKDKNPFFGNRQYFVDAVTRKSNSGIN